MRRLLVALSMMTMVGCTENVRARTWGGSETIKLPAGQKLVNATWKEANLWVLTRPMCEDEVAETWTFQEKSNWGVAEGTITFVESVK